jgi:hypothetical protein
VAEREVRWKRFLSTESVGSTPWRDRREEEVSGGWGIKLIASFCGSHSRSKSSQVSKGKASIGGGEETYSLRGQLQTAEQKMLLDGTCERSVPGGGSD